MKNDCCSNSAEGTAEGTVETVSTMVNQTKSNIIVFARDSTEFHEAKLYSTVTVRKLGIDSLANKTVILDDASAYKSLKTKVEDFFGFGRHHNIQVIYLAHYAKDVLPIVREIYFKIFITFKNPDTFFETIIQTYSIKELRWKQYRDRLEFGITEFDTRSQKYKILNHKYNLVYDSSKRNKWSPEDYVAYEGYFFSRTELIVIV